MQVSIAGEDFDTVGPGNDTAVVGQKIEAKMIVDPEVTVIPVEGFQWRWGVSDNTILDYITNANQGRVIYHASIDLYDETVKFYNPYGGSSQTSCSFTVAWTQNGQTRTLNTTESTVIDFVKPTAILTAVKQTSTMVVEYRDGSAKMSLSNGSSLASDQGMYFSASITAPIIGGGGSVSFMQTCTAQHDRTSRRSDPPQEISSHKVPLLDLRFPYGNIMPFEPQEWPISAGQYIGPNPEDENSKSPIWTVDSPSEVFEVPDPVDPKYYHDYKVNDSFTMYLIYKPAGNDSIWVPLRQTSWTWIADASWNGNEFVIVPNSDKSSCDPSDKSVSVFPLWTSNTNNIIGKWKNK